MPRNEVITKYVLARTCDTATDTATSVRTSEIGIPARGKVEFFRTQSGLFIFG